MDQGQRRSDLRHPSHQTVRAGNLAFTGKADGTVYAILLAKNEKEPIPESVEIPAELVTKAERITLLGYGAINLGQPKDGLIRVSMPADVHVSSPCADAWVFRAVPGAKSWPPTCTSTPRAATDSACGRQASLSRPGPRSGPEWLRDTGVLTAAGGR